MALPKRVIHFAAKPGRFLVLVEGHAHDGVEVGLERQEAVFNDLARHTRLKAAAVYGGVGMEPQTRAFKRGVDVVVATPGRLLDHLERRTVNLDSIEVLVLDEADRMLDMGFIDDVRKIVAQTQPDRQTLLFSATMPDAILGLAHEMMRDPVSVQVGFQAAASGITQVLHPVDYASKQVVVVEDN